MHRRLLLGWLLAGAAGFLLVPWYMLQDSVLTLGWLRDFLGKDSAPALVQSVRHGRWWLLPIGLLLALGFAALAPGMPRRRRGSLLLAVGALGFTYFLAQGFAIGARGFAFDSLTAAFGELATGQFGMGLGAAVCGAAFAMLFAIGIADRGGFKGDAFVSASVVAVALLVALFTFFPVVKILVSAVQDNDGAVSLQSFWRRLSA